MAFCLTGTQPGVGRVLRHRHARGDQTTLNGSNSNSSPFCGEYRSVRTGNPGSGCQYAIYNSNLDDLKARSASKSRSSLNISTVRFGEIVIALPLDDETRPLPGPPSTSRAARSCAFSQQPALHPGRCQQRPKPSVLRHRMATFDQATTSRHDTVQHDGILILISVCIDLPDE
jgi:hypothetical protein